MLALLVGVVHVVEFLSIPVSMIGIGTVLVGWGSFMTASVAMNFILTVFDGGAGSACRVASPDRGP